MQLLKHLQVKLLVSFVMVIVLISACRNKKTISIPAIPVFTSSLLDTVYNTIRPTIQYFTIDNKMSNTIKTTKGTEILIPAECFVNGNGDEIYGTIQLEVAEAFSLNDFISSGLVTISGNELLISNGMMYINAKSGDEQLQIKKENPLTVSMPTIGNNYGFTMFTGDGSDWKEDISMTEYDYEIPLPLNLLYPEGNQYFWYCIINSGEADEKFYLFDTSVVSVTNKKYENTIIATREFDRRVPALRHMMYNMSYFVNRDYYFDVTACENQKFNYDIFNVYFDHPDRSFKESDSIAKDLYLKYFNANKVKIEAFCNEVNIHKRKYYSNWTDTNYYFDFRETTLEQYFMEPLKFFPPSNTKEIKLINTYGVDLNAPDAFAQLKAKKVDSKEINEILTYNFRRQSLIKILQREKDAAADKQKIEKIYASTIFSVTVLGWINCDRFYDDPDAGKAEIFVSNNSGNNLDYIDYSLVIPEINARLSAFISEKNMYSFTQKDGRYIKLPIGKPAIIIGVAVKKDSIFFASQKIIIKDGLNLAFPMKYIRSESLNDSLKKALP